MIVEESKVARVEAAVRGRRLEVVGRRGPHPPDGSKGGWGCPGIQGEAHWRRRC